jgi:predicted ATPase
VLWSDEPFEVTRLRLRQELCRLRKALGSAAALISSDSEYVHLDLALAQSDHGLLRHALRVAPSDPEFSDAILRAAELCGEPLLPDWTDDWLVSPREIVEQRQGRCLAEAARICYEAGDLERSLRFSREALRYRADDAALRDLAESSRARLTTASRPDVSRALVADPEVSIEPPKRDGGEKSRAASHSIRPDSATLPRPLDTFFGRPSEIEEVLNLLTQPQGPRLLTLMGPGGMGKTRLATEIGLRLPKGGVAFTSLAELESAEQVPASMVTQLGLQATPDADLLAFLARAIPGEPFVLIMDNLEHLLPDAAPYVSRLLSLHENLRILATSRVAVRISGEHRLALGPLDADTAGAEMMTDLGRAVRPGLRVDETTEEAFRQLAHRLEGIPLAIRLAAPRLRFLSPPELLNQLEGRLTIRGAAADLAQRHRSLETALTWSYEALSVGERAALLAIAQFPGGCQFDQLGRIVSNIDVFHAAETLSDSSLITIEEAEPYVRLGMLETVRESSR